MPKFTVEDAEKLIKLKSKTTTTTKGYKFSTEGHVNNIELKLELVREESQTVKDSERQCHICAKCWRSVMRKNEAPHNLKLVLYKPKAAAVEISNCLCSCKAGQSFCNHMVALVYTLAHYVKLGLKAISPPASCTSLPQQWHKPRVCGIKPESILKVTVKDPCKAAKEELSSNEDLQQGCLTPSSSGATCQNKKRRTGIHSTLYDPLPDNFDTNKFVSDFCSFVDGQPNPIQFSQVLRQSLSIMRLSNSEFGAVPRGSILSYQCLPKQSDDLVKIYGINGFQDLPIKDFEIVGLYHVPNQNEALTLESFSVNFNQSISIEKNTREQSNNPGRANLRKDRLTVSEDFKRIYSGQGDNEKLAEEMLGFEKE